MMLRDLLKIKKIKQSQIAARLGVSEATVSKWARGHQRIPTQYLRPLAVQLEVTIDDLVPVEPVAA